MKLGLVDDWKQCWKWLSVQFAVLIAAAPAIYEYVPQLQDAVSAKHYHWIMGAMAILLILGRLKDQQKPAP